MHPDFDLPQNENGLEVKSLSWAGKPSAEGFSVFERKHTRANKIYPDAQLVASFSKGDNGRWLEIELKVLTGPDVIATGLVTRSSIQYICLEGESLEKLRALISA